MRAQKWADIEASDDGSEGSTTHKGQKWPDIEVSDEGSEESTTHPVDVLSSAQAPTGSGVRAQDDEGATIEAKSEGLIQTLEKETSGSRATEAFEARASELPRPPEDAAAEKAATEKGK